MEFGFRLLILGPMAAVAVQVGAIAWRRAERMTWVVCLLKAAVLLAMILRWQLDPVLRS